jgi:hypothetical protein
MVLSWPAEVVEHFSRLQLTRYCQHYSNDDDNYAPKEGRARCLVINTLVLRGISWSRHTTVPELLLILLGRRVRDYQGNDEPYCTDDEIWHKSAFLAHYLRS